MTQAQTINNTFNFQTGIINASFHIIINKDPYGEGWMVKVLMSDASEVDALMSAEEYTAMIEK